jgi:DNA-binding NarL/FixJ family response regulator
VRPLRVVLVEDNDVFREALELLLGLRPDIEVVASEADGRSAAALCRRLAPDVALVDYRLPGLDGVEVTAAIRRACPDVAVVCLTANASTLELDALRAAGASECVTKDEPIESIVAAIHRSAGDGSCA